MYKLVRSSLKPYIVCFLRANAFIIEYKFSIEPIMTVLFFRTISAGKFVFQNVEFRDAAGPIINLSMLKRVGQR